MNCAEFEVLLADYCDDTLLPADRSMLEEHALTCSRCGEFKADVLTGFAAGREFPALQPPPELINRLAHAAPEGKSRKPTDYQSGASRFLERWLRPYVQPRWAMGMAMTILSFGMLERCTGLPVQHLQAADLNPLRVWNGMENRALRLKDRGVKYYENIRLVYEVEVRLHQLEAEQASKQRSGNQTGQGSSEREGSKQ